MDLIREIQEGLKKPGKSKSGLAKALGRTPATVTEILRPPEKGKPRQIKAHEIQIIRDYFELDPAVPIVGTVGASAEAFFYGEASDAPAETVKPPPEASVDTVAVEIRGESLGPGFNGWVAYYDDVREPITDDLIGWLCVVGLADGRVLIKIPRRSKTKGLYHLESNIGGEFITDVEIVWAARVKAVLPKS
jgi:hypothetical protein